MARRRETYAALLRGVNVGARNKVSMADLRDLFAHLGYEDVQTYLQSGNVVFSSRDSAAAIIEKVEAALAHELAVPAAVVVRTKTELRRVVDGNPFADRQRDPTKLLVTFLAQPPAQAAVRALDPNEQAPDEFHIARREVYLHCPNGYGRTKLSNAYLERKLGVVGTNRNWRTVTALSEKCQAL